MVVLVLIGIFMEEMFIFFCDDLIFFFLIVIVMDNCDFFFEFNFSEMNS